MKGFKMFFKSKSDVRAELSAEVEAFLRSGGSVVTVKPRKAPKLKQSAKSSRIPSSGTSGFSVGFPTKSFL
jgi:hypothetical protein